MTLDQQLDVINYLCNGCILVPLAVGLGLWRHLPANARVLWWMLAVLFLLEVVANWLRWNQYRNHFVYYFRMLTVLGCVTMYYTRVLPHPRVQWGVAGLITLLMVVEVTGWVGFNHINTVTLTATYFITTLYAFRGLQLLFDTDASVSMARNATIFYHVGLFILGFSSMVCIPLKSYFIETALDLFYFFDTLWVLLEATAFLTVAVGFWQEQKPYRLPSSSL